MIEILKFSGSVFVILLALMFSKEYETFLSSRISVLIGFSELLKHIRTRVDCFQEPISDLMSGFENEALERSGYLKAATVGDISNAYFEREGELSLSADAKKILFGFFKDFGEDYRDGTLRLTDEAIASLDALQKKESMAAESSLKVCRTLAVALALGAVILLI